MHIGSTLRAVAVDFIRFFNAKTPRGRYALGAVGILVVAVLMLTRGEAEVTVVPPQLPEVRLVSVADIAGAATPSFIGTVESVSQARLQTESSGLVRRVPVTLGQQVAAGAVIAELENQSEYAALLQAQGAYEAARANAAGGNLGVSQAETAFRAAVDAGNGAVRASYTTASNGVFATLDDYFTNPDSALPQIRIGGTADSGALVRERIAFQDILPEWQRLTTAAQSESELEVSIPRLIGYTGRLIAMTDSLIGAVSTREGELINGVPTAQALAELSGLRASLTATQASLEGARTGLAQASDALAQANLGGTNTEVSLANAQLKQALGVLRAAEANYNKTIVRAPIAGTLNELSVREGDFVGQFTPVALVANNDALLVSVFVNETDLAQITLGGEAILNGTITGTVTAVAPAADAATRKTEVQITAESSEVRTGTTVTVRFPFTLDTAAPTVLAVPIEAVRFVGEAAGVFTLGEGNRLTLIPVTIGAIRGNQVVIETGIDATTTFVADARGLAAGQEVRIAGTTN